MTEAELTVNGEQITIQEGAKFDVHQTLNFGMNETFEPGDTITLEEILFTLHGYTFRFTAESDPDNPQQIVKFAMENNLENEYLTFA